MPTDFRLAAPLAALALLLAGCAAPPPGPAPVTQPAAAAGRAPDATLPALAGTAPAVPVVATPAPPPLPPLAAPHPADAVLAHADRLRALAPADQAAEVLRLGDAVYTPERALQLALALARQPGQAPRAQALLERVLADPAGAPLHPLARLVASQLADQRRAEEQAERQAQQLREAQRRIEQLNERLEAVRTIERSLRTAPRPAAPPR